jgi:hypothetical protein
MAGNYIKEPSEKAREARGTVFMPALYISRSPGELSGRAGSLKMGADGLLEWRFYIQIVDSYIEETPAGLEKVLFYIRMGEVYISGCE